MRLHIWDTQIYSQRASRMYAQPQIFIDWFILRFLSLKNVAIL